MNRRGLLAAFGALVAGGAPLAAIARAPVQLRPWPAPVFIDAEWRFDPVTGTLQRFAGELLQIEGGPFGVRHQLVSWWGPIMPIGCCTAQNGVASVNVHGDAIFHGSVLGLASPSYGAPLIAPLLSPSLPGGRLG